MTDQIKDGKDIFGRNAQFVRCEIDETFPRYIREHQKELGFLLIMNEEKGVQKVTSQNKSNCKKQLLSNIGCNETNGQKNS